ncbi:hypothetical protein EMPG_17423 [Blastomyces silverae]|uniref:Uncharacterized protein n=1 Tax=Blastomyces silverae TaxID=2060906 RepID=A0A0H1B6L5_9EURO|nr:hypothetical protein EMPG_17423 [Blastomyces silverae]
MEEGRSSRKGVSENGQENAQATCLRPSFNETKSRRYEIRTLLDIGRRLGARSDSSAYSTKTIDVATLRHRREDSGSRVLTEKPVNRHRISSSFSMSNEDGLLLTQSNNVQYPRRQPLNAPQGTLAQSDAGFARFLKEHASPKHHRVTAGGRIVPMNLASSPAPEFKLPIKSSEQVEIGKPNNNCLQNRPLKKCADFNQEREDIQHPGLRCESDSNKPVGFNFLVPRAISGSDSGDTNHPHHTVPNSSTRAALGKQTQRQANEPLNSHRVREETVQQVTSESTSVSFAYSVPNGGADQAGWVPNHPQPYHASSSSGQVFPMAYTTQHGHGAVFGMYPVDQSGLMISAPPQLFPVSTIPINQAMIQNAQVSNLAMPSAGLSEEPLNQKSFEKATQEYDKLTDQLANLDRYLAIHSWDIDPAAKKILIDQRVELVMKLDAARSTKEQIEAAIQFLTSRPMGEDQSLGHQQFSNEICGLSPWPSNIGQYTNNVFLGGMNPTGCLIPGMGLPMADSFNNPFSEQARLPFTTPGPVNGFEGCQTLNEDNNGNSTIYDWAGNTNLMVDNNYTILSGEQVNRIQPSGEDSTQPSGEDSTQPSGRDSTFESASETATECTPPEIARVYHDIEIAASRGEPLGPLIEELAIVARKLNISGATKNQGLAMQHEKEPQCTASAGKQLALVPFNGGTTIASSSDKSNRTRSTTTNSLGTSQDSMNQNPTISTPGKICNASSQINGGKGKNGVKRKGDDKNIHSGGNLNTTKNTGPNEEKRQTYDGASGVGNPDVLCDDNGGKRHNKQKMRAQDSPTPVGKAAGAVVVDKPTSRTAARGNEIPFSPWKQAGQDTGLPSKANTSTASHKVNAYGFVPRFDGAGDADDRNPKAASAVLNSAVGGAGAAKTTGEKWYRKTPRKDPDPLDVRAFFQHLREQEKELMDKHRKDSRPFG